MDCLSQWSLLPIMQSSPWMINWMGGSVWCQAMFCCVTGDVADETVEGSIF